MKYECFEKRCLIRIYKVTAIKIHRETFNSDKKKQLSYAFFRLNKIDFGLISRNDIHCFIILNFSVG